MAIQSLSMLMHACYNSMFQTMNWRDDVLNGIHQRLDLGAAFWRNTRDQYPVVALAP
jgi:hypothetical protein